MKYIIFIILISILLGGCKSPKDPSVSFPVSVELQFDSIIIPPRLLSVTRLFIAHDMLIAYEQRKDTLFSFWKLPKCQYLFSAGIKGQGPDDFLMLDKVFVETDNGFKTFELASNKIKEIEIDSIGEFKLLAEQRLNINKMPLNRFTFLSDDSYCFLSDDDNYEYTLLDKEYHVRSFSHYPQLLYKEKDENNSYLYNKLLVSKPDGERFAAFYTYIKMLRVYDKSGDMLKEVLMDEPVEVVDNGKRTVCYSTYPSATNQCIYVLNNESEFQKYLEVWSWDGDPITRYSLDKKINAFVVSEKYNTIYAINRDIDNVIYLCKIK